MSKRVFYIFCAMGIVALTIYANISVAQMTTDGLISYWSFDADTDGTTVKDIWGSNDGSISGDPKIVEGKAGKALEFDGDDYVDCGSDASLLLGDTDLSLALWFKQTKVEGNRYIAGTYSNVNGKYYELWAEDGALFWSIDDDVVKSEIEFSPIEADQWYYAVGVRESGKEIRLYVNGVLGATGDDQSGDIASDAPMFFGDRFAGERPLIGMIDEVGLYGRALTEDEILKNYMAEGMPAAVSPADKLSGIWGKIKAAR